MSTREIRMIHRFYSRALDNFRTLYLYLPPSYAEQPERRFPVLYMHDGQNIFDGSESYSGMGWEIDRIAEDLIRKRLLQEIIIVGIAHQNEHRLSEYAHWDGSYEGHPVKGRGLLYERFLLEDVKPFIESNFRVLPGPENTALMGSSMGGLVTFHIGIRHPEAFGKLGVVSPSFWWGNEATLNLVRKLKRNQLPRRMWMDMGMAEGGFTQGFFEVLHALHRKGPVPLEELACLIVPEALHSEPDWMRRVHCPLLYFFGETGYPEHLELHGRDLIGLSGPLARVIPIVRYSTGFMMTPYPVQGESSHPEVLTVEDSWTLKPWSPGATTLTLRWNGLSTSKGYMVTEDLSETVTLTVRVEAASGYEGPLFMGVTDPQDIELLWTGERYEATLELPRDSVLGFKFNRGSWSTVVCCVSEDAPEKRILAADDRSYSFVLAPA